MKISILAADIVIAITGAGDEPLFSLAADHYTVSIDLDKLVTEVGSLAELVQRVENKLYKAAS
jgi:PleD family two-component response regulator